MTISPDSTSPLISAEALKAALGRVRVFDVRFDLARPDADRAVQARIAEIENLRQTKRCSA